MNLVSLGTALPDNRRSQLECWEALRNAPAARRLRSRSLALLEKVLCGNSGIESRHFAVADLASLFAMDVDSLHNEFARHAPPLAAGALGTALETAAMSASEIDALLVCTCTGYLCPGLSSYVAERLGLRQCAFLQDLVGLGCGGAIPMLRAASAIAAQSPSARIATVAVEICSAAFYLDDDPGVLISACLFGDGAAAAIWSGERTESAWRTENFDTVHLPEHRELLRFEQKNGFLRNKLDRTVPGCAAAAVGLLYSRRRRKESARVLTHPGGRDVLAALGAALPGQDLLESREVLRRCGNMSSPSVLFALQNFFEAPVPGADDLWLTGFGAGFSAHSVALTRRG